jgi:haloacetate dehalogenase
MHELLDIDYEVVNDSKIAFAQIGSGSPLLLLHGFPETHFAWHKVAPELAKHFMLIIPDIPGYGDSTGPAIDARHEAYSKRNMSAVLIAFMQKLGFEKFYVAAHDRGARVAYRMALDHPEKILRLALLDIIPTGEIANRLTYESASQLGNWWFLSQPFPFPETLIQNNTEYFLNYILDSWSGSAKPIAEEARNEYLRCFKNQDVIRTICEEYRAGISIDVQHDREDQKEKRRIKGPLLVLWASDGFVTSFGDPLEIWKQWAEDVQGHQIISAHFLMEEVPAEIQNAFIKFFS